jgi:hypothetical protein
LVVIPSAFSTSSKPLIHPLRDVTLGTTISVASTDTNTIRFHILQGTLSIQRTKPKTLETKMLRLCNPKPDLLKEVPRILLRPDLSIQSRLAGPKIRLRRLDELGLLVKLPEQEEAEVDGDDDVAARGERELADEISGLSGGFFGVTYAVTKS